MAPSNRSACASAAADRSLALLHLLQQRGLVLLRGGGDALAERVLGGPQPFELGDGLTALGVRAGGLRDEVHGRATHPLRPLDDLRRSAEQLHVDHHPSLFGRNRPPPRSRTPIHRWLR
jgi:hypothetical protein